VQNLLPWRPKPKDDELFSSWLLRVATGNSPKLHTFCHIVWPNRQLWNRDLDAMAPSDVVQTLASLTGTSATRARETTLPSLEGTLYERVSVNNASRWVLPLGVYHRTRRRAGQQWCGECLRADPQPYYRKNWRLAISSTCSRHGLVLADRCIECASPAVPHRGDDPNCHVCGSDRRFYPHLLARSEALQFEHNLRSILAGRARPPATLKHLYPVAFFNLVRQVLSIVTANPRAQRLRDVVCKHHGGDPRPALFETKLCAPELLSSADRHRMMAMVAHLLDGWPYKFAALSAEAGMWRSWAMRGNQDAIPYEYVSVAQRYLGGGQI